ncbi:hypothetical protein [Streptomyces sp. NPDC002540]
MIEAHCTTKRYGAASTGPHTAPRVPVALLAATVATGDRAGRTPRVSPQTAHADDRRGCRPRIEDRGPRRLPLPWSSGPVPPSRTRRPLLAAHATAHPGIGAQPLVRRNV